MSPDVERAADLAVSVLALDARPYKAAASLVMLAEVLGRHLPTHDREELARDMCAAADALVAARWH